MRRIYTFLMAVAAMTLMISCGGGSGTSTVVTPVYDVTLDLISPLDNSVRETSGLANLDGRVYTHNDSGNLAELYELNTTTGTVLRTITVNNAINRDWEDMASDADYLYIADIGDNAASRTQLQIYRILRSDLAVEGDIAVDAETITFTYDADGTPYDAEAIVVDGGRFYVFTKAAADNRCRLYSLPATTGDHIATYESERLFDVLITGADVSAGGRVSLIGYNTDISDFKIQIITLEEFTGNDLFSGTVTLHNVTNSESVGQAEAIAYNGEFGIYVTAEGVTIGLTPYPATFYDANISH